MADHPPLIQPAPFAPRRGDDGRQPWRPRPLHVLLALALLAFGASLWFLFSARSVLLTFDPPFAEPRVTGGPALQLGARYLLRPGRYTLTASAAGHHDLRQVLEVTAAGTQTHHFTLQRLPGKLSFTSVPTNARVFIDDRMLGTTPLRDVDVAAGERALRVLAERHLPHDGAITVAGMGQAEAYSFTLQPAWAEVAIASIPAGATIYVDGEASGRTPATLELLQGEHQVMLKLPRHRDWQQDLSITAGQRQTLGPVRLAAADGVLALSSTPAGANVTVNGEYLGRTPLEVSLAAGREHRVSVLKPGHARADRNLALAPEERQSLHLELQPRLGEVLVKVEPATAEIVVNGEPAGRGSRTLSLPSFEQTLEVRHPGYRSHRQRFTPRPDLSQVINVRLLSEPEAQLAELQPQITSPGGQTLRLFNPGELTPGGLTLGASRREPGRRANEVLRPVVLSRLFYLGTHEVTNLQFRRFREAHISGSVEGNSLARDTQPVVMVSWNDAALYCNWLSEQEQLPPFYTVQDGEVVGFDAGAVGYRLPTEAEWAWAARVDGDSLLKFPWGDGYPPTAVTDNYADESSALLTGRRVPGYRDGHAVSAPVGSFAANQRGLHDMGGNVAEWMHDVYGLPSGGGQAETDPLGPQQGKNRVVRGASWAHGTVTELRLSFRDYGSAGRDDVGFRVARYARPAAVGE